MRSIGTLTVKGLDNSIIPQRLPKPLNEYTFKAIDEAVDGSGYLCAVCDGEECICIADVRGEDIESFTRHPIVPNTILTDIMAMFSKIESELPGEL